MVSQAPGSIETYKVSTQARVVELKNKCEAIERREAERRAVDERKRKEEIDFLKPLGFGLEASETNVECARNTEVVSFASKKRNHVVGLDYKPNHEVRGLVVVILGGGGGRGGGWRVGRGGEGGWRGGGRGLGRGRGGWLFLGGGGGGWGWGGVLRFADR